MSIASEIQDLQTNLQAAKTAVTTKGGTVGDTGLAGLATEIASIPSGGGPLASYGTVTYLDDNNVEQTLVLTTVEDFYELCNQDPSTANVHIGNTVFTKEKITGVTIADGVTFIPDYFGYYCTNLTNISLPNTVAYIGSYFGYYTKIANKLNLTNVEAIGNSFLSGISVTYTEDIDLPKVYTIGPSFLYNFYNFNGNVNLNDGCKIIGGSFMQNCWGFDKSFVIPSGLEALGTDSNPGTSFMRECKNFTGPLVCNSYNATIDDDNTLSTKDSSKPLYATGVTLTGPYAQQWKDFFRDRTSSPYRKLIVGS
jgi:hypothetical protein